MKNFFKKALPIAGVAFLVYMIAFRPKESAEIVKTLGRTLADIGRGIGDFFSALVS
ncbi:MAG TPA: hypothetical protein VM581_01435 [Magnetospirillaceae bacterium]|nr:hypothetical protein [Magnetospirillaceae bacterium]